LNILGLAIGLAASVLIFLVIRWETSYDSYHPNKDRVYRVVTTLVNRSNGEVVVAAFSAGCDAETDRRGLAALSWPAALSFGDVIAQLLITGTIVVVQQLS
jgi:hypothetical protein